MTDQQRPLPGDLVVDHVAHWVPDAPAAAGALAQLGFTVTPFSAQNIGNPPVLAGTGNHCVMLRHGYLEFLAPTGDTPNAATLRAGMQRYTGVHLIAFGTADPAGDHRRLLEGGFNPLAPVALSRPIGTQQGDATARFTVVRTAAGTMPEGRVQFVEQHTPDYLWQPHWLDHANGALALKRVEICVADPEEALARYARYTGIRRGAGASLVTARGWVMFRTPDDMKNIYRLVAPCVPWIAGYALSCRPGTKARVEMLPPSLGGAMMFEPEQA